MTRLTAILLAALLASTAGAVAQDISNGKAGSAAEGTRDASTPVELKAPKSVGDMKADRSATRAVITDPVAAAKAFTFVGRSRDGKDVTVEPAENVVKALMGEKTATAERAPLAKDKGGDPETGTDDAARVVVGKDERAQVLNTTRYPFSAVGYLEMADAKGEVYSCSAALVGPKTIITAAHCLYNHEDKQNPWRDKFTFWAALAGEEAVPFKGIEYDTAYVAQGFLDNYAGTYDSVWAFDLGVVTLLEPIGDAAGWLGSWSYPEMGDFTANIVGYPFDKTAFTQWRSTCDVRSEDVSDFDITYSCDVADGMQGAPIYVYDETSKERYVIGINIGDLGDKNWGLRLYQALYEWVQTVNK